MGITFGIISIKGLLSFSLYADTALVKDKQLLDEILRNTLQEIDYLYDYLTLSSPKNF